MIFLSYCSQIKVIHDDNVAFEYEVENISDSLSNHIPNGSNLLILDFTDLDNVITHFGRYLSRRISNNLSNNQMFRIVDRNNIELLINEQKLQLSGVIDESSVVNIGKIAGATHIVYGTVTEFQEYVGLDIKIISVENGTIIYSSSPKIEKTREVAQLVSTIVKSEEQQQNELEVHRQKILNDIESERSARLKAIEDEERQKKNQLVELENEIREKSIIISEYEARKKELQKQQTYIQQIHAEIDKLNADVLSKIKIGMTKEQIIDILGKENFNYSGGYNCYTCGRYFLIFEGTVLTKVVLNGSMTSYNTVVDDCLEATANGRNVARY